MIIFKKGDLVRHEKYGLATVEQLKGTIVHIILKDGRGYIADFHKLTLENAA